MRAKKSLGQNFLMHRSTAARIVQASGITNTDTVVEVGPGTGMLTRELLARAKRVIAIEKDDALIPTLSETFANEIKNKTLKLEHCDVRSVSITEKNYHVVANIPYYITGEIIRQFLTAPHKPQSMTLLVQKEVAERIVRSKKESLLSLSVKVFGTPKYCFSVPRGAFVPAPSVDSAVLHIATIQKPFSAAKETKFFALLHAGFAHKRKLLIKNLSVVASAQELTRAFATLGISEKIRAEDLSLETWKKLTEILPT